MALEVDARSGKTLLAENRRDWYSRSCVERLEGHGRWTADERIEIREKLKKTGLCSVTKFEKPVPINMVPMATSARTALPNGSEAIVQYQFMKN